MLHKKIIDKIVEEMIDYVEEVWGFDDDYGYDDARTATHDIISKAFKENKGTKTFAEFVKKEEDDG